MTFVAAGCECLVFSRGTTRMRKVYFTRSDRDAAYHMQRRLNRLRLAPAVYKRGSGLDILKVHPDVKGYYYDSRAARCYDQIPECEIKELGQRLFELGHVFTDPHEGNVGYHYGRLVVIDCGECSFRPRHKRDHKSYYEWWEKERVMSIS